MRKTCKFFDDIDLFGRGTELYYDGNSKLSSWVGKILTIVYIFGYFGYFIYKVIRMMQKIDVEFYDSYAFTGAPPFINLTKEKFYGGFALGDKRTMQTFVNNSIYFVKAYYISGVRTNGIWNMIPKELDIEVCDLEKFGKNYREIFSKKNMDKMHCVPYLNHRLEGHPTYDVYSYYLVKFIPCIGLPFCAPEDDVKSLLNETFLTFKMEDIDLTPQKYNSPVALRGKEVSATVGASLFQDVHSFFQIINIETDEDILGFDGLNKIKKEKYIKYDQSIILSQLKPEVFAPLESIVDVTIALSEQELTQKRTYPKLLEVLGDVGGLMEVVFSLFRILSMFLTEALYETSIVNHLFSFDLDKKRILIKDKKKRKKDSEISPDDIPKIYSPKTISTLSRRNSPIVFNERMNINTKDQLNDDDSFKNRKNTEKINHNKQNKKRTKKKLNANYLIKYNEIKSQTNLKINSLNIVTNRKKNENDIKDFFSNKKNEIGKEKEVSYYNKETEKGKKSENGRKRRIIKKVKHNRFCLYLCFCFVRKKRNVGNILIDEGMKVLTEKLDLMNLFKILYKEEKNQNDMEQKFEVIDMSEVCKLNLKKVDKNNKE